MGAKDDWDNNARAYDNTTLYARWEADVVFVMNNGEPNDNRVVNVNAGVPAVVTPPATNPAYQHDVFVDWFTNSGLTSVFNGLDINGDLLVNGHMTLYAGYGPAYTPGQMGPGGGTVYYVLGGAAPRVSTAQVWRFLEAAPADLSGAYQWGLYGATRWDTSFTPHGNDQEWFTNINHNVLGGGFDSTVAMLSRIAQSTDGSAYSNTAAQAADNYSTTIGGVTYDDWYLPSVNELLQMETLWTTLGLNNADGGVGNRYWSSTSYPTSGYSIAQMENKAWSVGREGGSLTIDPANFMPVRTATRLVRPVRRF